MGGRRQAVCWRQSLDKETVSGQAWTNFSASFRLFFRFCFCFQNLSYLTVYHSHYPPPCVAPRREVHAQLLPGPLEARFESSAW